MHSVKIDSLYTEFCDSLPDTIQPVARNLAHRLGLTPIPGVPWSNVFKHTVTLSAPAMLAEKRPEVTPEQLRLAVAAHMLAVIEAFGTDRITDGQVDADEPLVLTLALARERRDRALAALDPSASYASADGMSRDAMQTECEYFVRATPASYSEYARLSLGKQAVGFPASIALARALGCSSREIGAFRAVLADVWLGLQHHDDVVDWEDDWKHKGAWAVCLAKGLRGDDSRRRTTEPDIVRDLVLRSGVLATLLRRARRHYRSASRRARALGAHRLAAWAKEREATLTELERGERQNAGWAVRAFRMASWAEVIT